MVAAAGRDQDRRGKAGEDAEHGQGQRILQHREQADPGDEDDHQGECRQRWQQVIEPERGEHGQQQDADRATLQAQRKGAARVALAPGEHEGGHGREGNADQAELDWKREPAFVGRVLEQGGDAGEQHEHADLDRHVAFGEPGLDPIDDTLAEIGTGRLAVLPGNRRSHRLGLRSAGIDGHRRRGHRFGQLEGFLDSGNRLRYRHRWPQVERLAGSGRQRPGGDRSACRRGRIADLETRFDVTQACTERGDARKQIADRGPGKNADDLARLAIEDCAEHDADEGAGDTPYQSHAARSPAMTDDQR